MLSSRAVSLPFRLWSITTRAAATLCVSAAVAIGIASPAWADVKLPNVFSNNMVLQRDRPVPVWGTAAADEEVTVSIGDQEELGGLFSRCQWRMRFTRFNK
ncbi:MAG: hypothetical protein K8T25_00720 [Planctomycetia bacterium]|nr:hypothetical protein [Planctomycetia bacterium]